MGCFHLLQFPWTLQYLSLKVRLEHWQSQFTTVEAAWEIIAYCSFKCVTLWLVLAAEPTTAAISPSRNSLRRIISLILNNCLVANSPLCTPPSKPGPGPDWFTHQLSSGNRRRFERGLPGLTRMGGTPGHQTRLFLKEHHCSTENYGNQIKCRESNKKWGCWKKCGESDEISGIW